MFIEDRKATTEELRYYLEYPVEILLISNQYAKVRILTSIPRIVSAAIASVDGNKVYLHEFNAKKVMLL